MMNSFKLSELSVNTLVGRDIGKQTRDKIKTLIQQHSDIIIDMENKSSISPSFLDEAIVMLVVEYGKVDFGKYVKLININIGIKSLMNTILHDKVKRARQI